MTLAIGWPAILSPPHVKFLTWGTSPSLLTPMSSHGRAAMAMSLATFYCTWPWPYVGVSYFFWRDQLPTRYEILVCWGTSPPTQHAHVWPWPGCHSHGHEFGHVLPRFAMAMATFYRRPLVWSLKCVELCNYKHEFFARYPNISWILNFHRYRLDTFKFWEYWQH